ncbi:MAG: hypothetical protein WBQ59_06640, partial [Candidatus Acidiferrum sp.]
AEMDPIKAFEIIEGELSAFSEALTKKPRIVVATKLDATTDPAKLEELSEFCKERGLEFHAISAPTGEGVKDLVRGMADALDKIPKEEFDDAEGAAETSEDREDFEAYQDRDEMEAEEDEPPATEVS